MITNEIEDIKNQIVEKYNPRDILLFGSYAKGLPRSNSDVDICIIMDTVNKRQLLQEMLYKIEYTIDLDIVIYTEDEWQRFRNDTSTFACIINRTGVSILHVY